jgi:hypothetical protein
MSRGQKPWQGVTIVLPFVDGAAPVVSLWMAIQCQRLNRFSVVTKAQLHGRMNDALQLEELRCSGSAHAGCRPRVCCICKETSLKGT